MACYALGDDAPEIHPDAFVHPESTLIGAVRIGAEASVWPGVVIRADEAPISIGARTSIQDGTVIHTTEQDHTWVGDDCVVGHIAHLEGCVLEPLSLVGSGSVVLHRAVVRTGALVGAGAVVTNDTEVPGGAMALGIPAKIKPETVEAETMIKPNVDSYVARCQRYHREMRRVD